MRTLVVLKMINPLRQRFVSILQPVTMVFRTVTRQVWIAVVLACPVLVVIMEYKMLVKMGLIVEELVVLATVVRIISGTGVRRELIVVVYTALPVRWLLRFNLPFQSARKISTP